MKWFYPDELTIFGTRPQISHFCLQLFLLSTAHCFQGDRYFTEEWWYRLAIPAPGSFGARRLVQEQSQLHSEPTWTTWDPVPKQNKHIYSIYAKKKKKKKPKRQTHRTPKASKHG